MNFRFFQHLAKNLLIFNLNDIRKFDADFHRQQLTDWLKRGYIQTLAGGFYALSDVQVNENILYLLASRMYQPSYISRESALAYYLVIPESVLGITSVSSQKTMQLESEWGRFSYTSIKPSLMFGYRVFGTENMKRYKFAILEKAILDYLYRNNKINAIDDIAALRWNRQELLKLEDNLLFDKYLKIFNNKALDQRVSLLKEYIHA